MDDGCVHGMCELDQPYGPGPCFDLGDSEGKTGLGGAARPGERDETFVGERSPNRGDLAAAPHERVDPRGQGALSEPR